MSSFTDPLTVTKLPGGKWKVSRPFRYYIGCEGSSSFVNIPEDFETDFASVPRGLWNLFPPDGKYSQAAVLHDFLYCKKGRIKSIIGNPVSRKTCDEIFLEAMQVLGVPWLSRHIIFLAVRACGWLPWRG